jgi:hypothetical protein
MVKTQESPPWVTRAAQNKNKIISYDVYVKMDVARGELNNLNMDKIQCKYHEEKLIKKLFMF